MSVMKSCLLVRIDRLAMKMLQKHLADIVPENSASCDKLLSISLHLQLYFLFFIGFESIEKQMKTIAGGYSHYSYGSIDRMPLVGFMSPSGKIKLLTDPKRSSFPSYT